MLVIPDISLAVWGFFCRTFLNANPNLFKIGLYKSAYTPVRATTIADLTAIESTFTGYARQSCSPWADATYRIGGRYVAVATPVVFTLTAGTEDVYGYFIMDDGNTNLLGVEELVGGPVTLDLSNPNQYLIPRFTLYSEFP